MKTELQRWGNSLAIRIPREAVNRAQLRQGDDLELIVLRRGALKVRRVRRKLTLAQLVKGIHRRNRHEEVDWGQARGKEVW